MTLSRRIFVLALVILSASITIALVQSEVLQPEPNQACVSSDPTMHQPVTSPRFHLVDNPTPQTKRDDKYHNNLETTDCCVDIAHAGGSIAGQPYTNSLEALDRNYSLGRRVFEIDFSITCDGVFVLLHDWGFNGGLAVSRQQFIEDRYLSDLTAMDLEDLLEWLAAHPDARVVTDLKAENGNVQFLEVMQGYASDAFINEKFVIQIYTPSELASAPLAGLKKILTIYRLPNTTDNELIDIASNSDVIGLTIPHDRALRSLQTLRNRLPQLLIYVHGPPDRINSLELQDYLASRGASGFYQE